MPTGRLRPIRDRQISRALLIVDEHELSSCNWYARSSSRFSTREFFTCASGTCPPRGSSGDFLRHEEAANGAQPLA
jgi:hypothetical protein